MSLKKIIQNRKERGIAMMIALLSLLLLAAIGIGFMFMADTENSVNNNYRDAQKTYFAARAGMEDIRMLLAPSGALYISAIALTMPSKTLPTGVIYVKNPNASETAAAIDPTTASGATLSANPYLDDELCHEQFFGAGALASTPGVPCNGSTQLMSSAAYFTAPAMTTASIPNTGTAGALPFKWVRITNKQNQMGLLNGRIVDTSQAATAQVCWDGLKEVAIAGTNCTLVVGSNLMPVWLVTALAITPAIGNNPGSRRLAQMELALNPPLIPPASISTQAPVGLQGSFVINAYDSCSCTCVTTGNGASQTTTCTGASCDGTHHAIYTGGQVSVNGGAGQTVTAYGSDPTHGASVQNVNPWPFDTNALINQYKAQAQNTSGPPWNYSCSGTANFTSTPAVYKNCGTQPSQTYGTYPTGLPTEPVTVNTITAYVPGSIKLTSAASGAGILIVDGDLEINGGLNWYGLLLVRGKVSFTGGAGQNVNLYGAILAGEDVNATDQAQTDVFGGSINFHYDLCALKRVPQASPPKLLSTHEIMY